MIDLLQKVKNKFQLFLYQKLHECVAKAQNILQGELLDEAKIRFYFEKSVSDPNWSTITKQTALDCISKTLKKMDDLKSIFAAHPSVKTPLDCNLAIMSFTECHMTEMFVACPATSWNSTKQCNTAKASAAKCNSNVENTITQYISKIPKLIN